MQHLTIDTGVQEYSVNGRGVLRFNPGDPNLYHRFFAAGEPLARLDDELNRALAEVEQNTGLTENARAAMALELLAQCDAKLKALLGDIFGPENDIDAAVEGVNLAALSTNGKRVVQNLLEALAPILREGARRNVTARADAAVARADADRAARQPAPAQPAAQAAAAQPAGQTAPDAL